MRSKLRFALLLILLVGWMAGWLEDVDRMTVKTPWLKVKSR